MDKEAIHNCIVLWNQATVKVLDIRHVMMERGEKLSAYRLPTSTFLFSTNGSAKIAVDGALQKVERFHVMHGGKGMSLTITAKSHFEYYLIFYKAKFPLVSSKKLKQLLVHDNLFQKYYEFTPQFPLTLFENINLIYTEWQQGGILERLHAKAIFYRIVYELLRQLYNQDDQLEKTDLVSQVMDYIQKKYNQPLTLESLARDLKYNAQYLSRTFKHKMGQSPITYLLQVRMEKAQNLLLHTNATVREIAEHVGYLDEFYFNRMFKQYTGVTPGSFKRHIHEKKKVLNSSFHKYGFSIVNTNSSRYSLIDDDNHYQYKGEEDLHMDRGSRPSYAAMALLCITLLLGACTGGTANVNNETTGQQIVVENETGSSNQTRLYKDSQGNEVEIPTKPERIVLQGNAIGDLLALGIEPIGVDRRFIDSGVLEEKGKISSTDIGYPTNLEKVLSLEPDLIMLSYVLDKEVEEGSKIAPTVVFDGMLPLKERFPIVADIVGKEAEGKQILNKYEEDAEAMWQELRANGTVTEGETSVILQFYWNKMMYVMKTGGIADLLYQPGGFAMEEEVQALKPNSGPYIEIAEETMHETLVGDRLIVLLSADKDSQKAFEELQQLPLWQSLPAVKNNNVHYIEDKWNYTDMTTSEMLLEKLPKMLTE